MKEIEKKQQAFGMRYQEFEKLYDECKGFDSELYKNHPILSEGESFMDFLQAGSMDLATNDIIKNNLK